MHGMIRAGLSVSPCVSCGSLVCPLREIETSEPKQRFLRLTRGDRIETPENEACLRFWIVLRGTAATCTVFADGRRQILGLEGPGEVLSCPSGEIGAQSWLEALEDCEICEIDLSAQASILRVDPDFLRLSFHLVHRRLVRSQKHLSTLGRLDSLERVMLFLAEMESRHRAEEPGSPVTRLQMSREDIADYLGLNAETVSRLLTRARKSGLVKFLNRSEYVLTDMEALARRLPVELPDPAFFRSGPDRKEPPQ